MEDKGKGVAERLRECDDRPGCASLKIARTVGCGVMECSSSSCDRCLRITLFELADAIDAEVAAAREASARDGMAVIAAAEGWPAMRDGESVVDWMGRCWLPRPRFEDGEPVQSSDMEEIGALATCCVYTDGSWVFEPDKYEDEMNPKPWDSQSGTRNDRVKRPAAEVLDADGVPIKVGETVWLSKTGIEITVSRITENDEGNTIVCANDGAFKLEFMPCWITHTPPENQEDIDADATMSPAAYCAARGIDLGDDADRESATAAMIADLLRRQRELDKRIGGAE